MQLHDAHLAARMPNGSLAMEGMANAAVATFLVEALHKYITGDLLGLEFLGQVGEASGSMGGVAAAILVPIAMGVNPIYAVVAGAAVGGSGHDIYPVKNRRDNLHGNRPVTDRYGIPSWRTSCRKRRGIDLQTSS